MEGWARFVWPSAIGVSDYGTSLLYGDPLRVAGLRALLHDLAMHFSDSRMDGGEKSACSASAAIS